MANTKVVFAVDHTTADGKTHKGGSTAAVDSAEARDLVYRGLVQLAPNEIPTPTAADQDAYLASLEPTKGGK